LLAEVSPLFCARVTEHDVARRIGLGLQQIQLDGFRDAAQQRAAASEEERAGDELIFVDQTVLRELRSDGAAAEDHDVSTGLPFERLDRPPLEFVEQT